MGTYKMPGTTLEGEKASISVSVKKLLTVSFRVKTPTSMGGTTSNGQILVGSNISKSNYG
jgi:hypothetical protein